MIEVRFDRFLVLICMLFVTACSNPAYVELDTSSHKNQIMADGTLVSDVFAQDVPDELSLNQAIDRALKKNLDLQVAVYENLAAQKNVDLAFLQTLPNVTASGTYTERGNEAASESVSILTRTQSLEPSTSIDTDRRLADLQAQWNLLDATIAYLDARSSRDEANIAKERLRRVKLNIEGDVSLAFWRGLAGQKLEDKALALSKSTDEMMSQVERARSEKLLSVRDVVARKTPLIEKMENVNRSRQQSDLAMVELKSLISIPVSTNVTLNDDVVDYTTLYPEVKGMSDAELIEVALQNRPEMRESYALRNQGLRNLRREILSTFPGLNLVYGYNYDSNSFLVDPNYFEFTAALTQSITDLVTLPKRHAIAKKQNEIENARRLALTAAIIAQTHVGKIRTKFLEDRVQTTSMKVDNAKKIVSMVNHEHGLGRKSGFELINAQMDHVIAEVEHRFAQADLQKAYVDFYGGLGLSIKKTEIEIAEVSI